MPISGLFEGVIQAAKEVAMRSILNSRLGRASMTIAIAGLAILAAGTSAEAREFHHWNHWDRYHYAWHGPYYWGPRYYSAPVYSGPVYAPVYAPPAYYPPPGLTFTIPFG
jgi:hypothetical protein